MLDTVTSKAIVWLAGIIVITITLILYFSDWRSFVVFGIYLVLCTLIEGWHKNMLRSD